MDNSHQKEVWYELFLIMDIAILAAFAAITLHHLGEANDYSRIHFVYGSLTNATSIPFDALLCAQISYQIAIWNFIPAIITAIPIVIIAIYWSQGKLDLPLRLFMVFPCVAIVFHLIYISLISIPGFTNANCMAWV